MDTADAGADFFDVVDAVKQGCNAGVSGNALGAELFGREAARQATGVGDDHPVGKDLDRDVGSPVEIITVTDRIDNGLPQGDFRIVGNLFVLQVLDPEAHLGMPLHKKQGVVDVFHDVSREVLLVEDDDFFTAAIEHTDNHRMVEKKVDVSGEEQDTKVCEPVVGSQTIEVVQQGFAVDARTDACQFQKAGKCVQVEIVGIDGFRMAQLTEADSAFLLEKFNDLVARRLGASFSNNNYNTRTTRLLPRNPMRRNPLRPFDQLLLIHTLPRLDLAGERLFDEGILDHCYI